MQFSCEIIHPVVRPEPTEVNMLLQLFNTYLQEDGFAIIEKTKISDKPVFIGGQNLKIDSSTLNRNAEIISVLSEDYIAQKITRMEGAIETDPDLAIGTAKELKLTPKNIPEEVKASETIRNILGIQLTNGDSLLKKRCTGNCANMETLNFAGSVCVNIFLKLKFTQRHVIFFPYAIYKIDSFEKLSIK